MNDISSDDLGLTSIACLRAWIMQWTIPGMNLFLSTMDIFPHISEINYLHLSKTIMYINYSLMFQTTTINH